MLSYRKMPNYLNLTQLGLILEKSKPDKMGDLRPIALCNVVYKIYAKVLANRIKSFPDNLISECQSAFVPSRSITYNIIVAFEIHQYMKRKWHGRDGYVALKVDMSKAYDRVE